MKKKRKTKNRLAVITITKMMLDADPKTIWEPEMIKNEFMNIKYPNIPPTSKEGYAGLLRDNIKDFNATMYKVTQLIKNKGHLLLIAKKPSVNPSTNRYTNKTLYWKVCDEPPTKEDEKLKIEMDENNQDKANNQKTKIESRNKFFLMLKPFTKHYLREGKEART